MVYMSNAKVELMDVALNGCGHYGIYIPNATSVTTLVATRCEFANSKDGVFISCSLTSATFNNCVFNDNSIHGIVGMNHSTIHLHGEATAVHSNEGCGIFAHVYAKVILHLPSHHNTSYNNGNGDRVTSTGGTTRITNVDLED